MIAGWFMRRTAVKSMPIAVSEGTIGAYRVVFPSLIHPLMPPKVQWFVRVGDEGAPADITAGHQQPTEDAEHRKGR
jgi:hypothetical protein